VDESNRRDFYGFAAILADEYATRDLTAALNRLMRQAAVYYGIPSTTELHGYPMFHGKESWSGCRDPRPHQCVHEGDRSHGGQWRHDSVAISQRRPTPQTPVPRELPCELPP
jgi:hypothetical protein